MWRCQVSTLMLTLLACVICAEPAFPQEDLSKVKPLLGGSAEILKGGATTTNQVSASLTPSQAAPGDTVTLAITVDLSPGSYTYPTKTRIGKPTKFRDLQVSGLVAVDDAFQADRPPKVVRDEILDEEISKYVGQVTFSRKYRVAADATAGKVRIEGLLDYQVCTEKTCTPLKTPFEVALAELLPPTNRTQAVSATTTAPEVEPETPRVVHPFSSTEKPQRRGKPDPIEAKFSLSPADAKPGEKVTLTVAMTLEEDWHTFALSQNPKNAGLPSVIEIAGVQNLTPLDRRFQPTTEPKIERPASLEGREQRTHYDQVTWTRTFQVADTTGQGEYGVSGSLRYQICSHGRCLSPKTLKFELGELTTAAPLPEVEIESSLLDAPIAVVDDDGNVQGQSLPVNLLLAFLGGLILNVMPCVLPVLAIKVLGFVQQAGESRARILALNIAYSAGVIGVFLVLASLAVFLKLGWGGLFQDPRFNLVMACVVFAMGLSLLGVFEIPMPGAVGSAAGGDEQEGLPGALMTGVFATLLATPCTGPFMGTTLAWSVQQPTLVVYLIWGTMGLGMASPYLLIGLFPRLVNWLPQPGMWMVRFKEFAGFVLMATVIFLVNAISSNLIVPLLVMLLGIALGVWMIGNLYDHSTPTRRKMAIRTSALVCSGVMILVGWRMTLQGPQLPWRDFNTADATVALAENDVVLIDFTADWCLICKQNEKFALNTKDTIEFVEEHGVVTMYADYTTGSPEIAAWLQKFNHDGVPLTLILRGGEEPQAIVLRGPYSKSTLLAKLEKAVSGLPDATSMQARVSAQAR